VNHAYRGAQAIQSLRGHAVASAHWYKGNSPPGCAQLTPAPGQTNYSSLAAACELPGPSTVHCRPHKQPQTPWTTELTVAGCLDGVRCIECVCWEGHLTEVATHHIGQRRHTQAVIVVGGTVNLVLVDGDAWKVGDVGVKGESLSQWASR
jgi:hypothetical protein